MKNQVVDFLKQHVLALIVFIIISFLYFSPVLEGKIIAQSDIIQSKSMQGEIIRYLENNDYILWTNSMFSGMPATQIWLYPFGNFIGSIIDVFRVAFGDPTYLLIAAMLGIYFFCLTLNINRYLAIIASIGFALSSFYIISIEAGHTNKAYGMALAAPFLASIIMVYRGNLFLGFLLTALFSIFTIRTNHVQITYYAVIAAAVLTIFELYRHFAEKKLVDFSKKIGLLAIAALIGLASNASLLWPTYDYAKHTIRGGGSELKEKAAQTKSGGLDKEYAFSWSQGIVESFSFIVPSFSGGASGEPLDEDSETYKTLTKKGVSPTQAKNIIQRVPTYWGNQPFTAGPIYFGATVLFLFLFGFLISKNSLKWSMLAIILLAMFLAWGKNFAVLSYFFFDYVPLYNKFRTPAMLVFVIMLFVPIVAVLGLNELLNNKIDKSFLLKNLKISGGVTAGLCLALWLGSSMFDYKPDPARNQTDTQYYENFKSATNDEAFATSMLDALRADRESMMKSDALRSLFFILLVVILIYLFIENKLKFELMAAGLSILVLVDLWGVDKRYLNDSNFVESSEYDKYFRPRPVDLQILRDTELHYRVHDVTTDPFNSASASYNLKTIGGYHAAKLQRYQEVIEKHIRTGNMNVLNMLNAKYFIVKGNDGQAVSQQNPDALGNAWAVENIQWVRDADEEINALTDFNPDSLAVIDERFKSHFNNGNNMFTGAANVALTSYHPDKMKYNFDSESEQLVVFSEVFYNGNKDWISYLDGKEVEHIRVNYLLRGLKVPAGKHEILFEFKPTSYVMGVRISYAANILFILLVAGYFFKRYKNKPAVA
jgi:hypothetical protein